MVAIAGPPGAGKSVLADGLCETLVQAGESAAVVPMDGFHLDDRVLEARGLLSRKGAPETFDAAGLLVLLRRLKACEPEVAIPIFDRSIELSRAAAAIVPTSARILLVEGNYLLFDEAPWRDIAALFDLSIFLDVDRAALERRLIRRWLHHGHTEEAARARALSNDLPNAERVMAQRLAADIIVSD